MTVRRVRAPARGGAVAAVLLAAAVLAGCSNHSGLRRLHPSGSEVAASGASGASVALPSGLAAGSSTAGSPTASRKHSSSPTASPTSAAPSSTAAAASHGTSRHSGASSPAHRPPHSSTPAPPRSSVPPSPSVGVSPGSGLHGGEQVTVSGAYFAAGERVGVQQCRSSLSACVGLTARSATADGGGAFRTSFIVSSTVQLSSCHTDGCVIRVRRSNGDAFVVPISFG